MNYLDLMAALRRARKNCGKAQKEVAEAMGLTGSQFCRIESGQADTSVARLLAWAAAVGLEVRLEGREG